MFFSDDFTQKQIKEEYLRTIAVQALAAAAPALALATGDSFREHNAFVRPVL